MILGQAESDMLVTKYSLHTHQLYTGEVSQLLAEFPRRKGLTLCVNVARFIDVLMLGIQQSESRKLSRCL